MNKFRIKHIIVFLLISMSLGYALLWLIFTHLTDLIPNAEIFVLFMLYAVLLAITSSAYSTRNLIVIHKAMGMKKTAVRFFLMALFSSVLLWFMDYFYQVYLLQIDLKQAAFKWSLSKEGGNWEIIFISMVVLAPIIEEIIFRWLFLQTGRHYLTLFWATFFTSVLFALVHFSLILFPSVFLASLLYVYLTIKSKSLYPAIFAHIINNSLTFYCYSILLN